MTFNNSETGLDESSIKVLCQLLVQNEDDAPNAVKFRAKNHHLIELLDRLKSDGYLEVRDNKYFLRLLALKEVAKENQEARNLLDLCEHIFPFLRQWYVDNAGDELRVEDLAKIVGIAKPGVQIALHYLSHTYIFDGWSSSKDEGLCAVRPAERLVRYENFSEVLNEVVPLQDVSLDQHEAIDLESIDVDVPSEERLVYVDADRIRQLADIESAEFDFCRLVRICYELNDCYERRNFLAVGGLLRSLLDHVPPVFGHNSFKVVANSYSGHSIRKSLLRLENSSRNISDSILHQQIRRKESLPNRVTVDFSSDLDVLLAEIIRISAR